MLTIIRTELIKLKRSPIIVLILLTGLFIPALSYFYYVKTAKELLTIEGMFTHVISIMNSAIGTVVFSIMTSFIVAQEYKQNTINQLLTYPAARFTILLGKFFVIMLLIAVTMLLCFIFTLGLGMILIGGEVPFAILIKYSEIHIGMIVVQFALMPMIACICVLNKNYLIAIAIGIVLSFGEGIMAILPVGAYYPWSAPKLISLRWIYDIEINTTAAFLSLSVVFIIPLLLSLYVYQKADIHSGS